MFESEAGPPALDSAKPHALDGVAPPTLDDPAPQALDGVATQALRGESATAPTVEISNAISHIHKQFVGRGPANARTTIDGNLVVCLLDGGYTRAEQTLEGNARGDVVAAGRLGLQDAMREAMIGAVERTLAKSVVSFMSANDIRQNLQVEVFVLTSSADETAVPLP